MKVLLLIILLAFHFPARLLKNRTKVEVSCKKEARVLEYIYI